MDFTFLAEADAAALQFEKAKRTVETAKVELENAKLAYDEILKRSEQQGIPRAKLKKITDDRIAVLFDSGILDFAPAAPKEVKPKKPKAAKSEAASDGEEISETPPGL